MTRTRNAPPPDRNDLVAALHLMRHQYATFWQPAPQCGCYEWADTILYNWPPASDPAPDADTPSSSPSNDLTEGEGKD